ncbi:STAS domain-containing protein [Planomonospora sp. ID67723]|uniref:STAS domain-containing protein n=1 Tax=Planomonospora sp. ID67723 TaxID=2738134 RepID=UPI0018C39AA5|nr:STAS domain-containing protein [Planomonospora sp. ID67723]MBG0833076.1 STAS domain-containing protein [Planomonospora sp. ID67723]
MDLSVISHESPAVHRVSGEIDISTAPVLHARLQSALTAGGRLLVDLSGVTFMDARGLGTLVAVNNTARELGGTVQLIGVPAAVRRLLRLTGLNRLFTLEPALLCA